MDDVIAIKIRDTKQGAAAFLTWGRIFDRLDMIEIRNHVVRAVAQFGFANVKSAVVCESLQEVAHYPYFYEALIKISWKPIPFGKSRKSWVAKKRAELKAGKEIYFLGRSKKY